MVRLGMTKRSPSTKSSNQRCSLTMGCSAGSNSVMTDFLRGMLRGLMAYRYRTGVIAATSPLNLSYPGIVVCLAQTTYTCLRSRVSTSLKQRGTKDVDGRDEPGHDGARKHAAVIHYSPRQNLDRIGRAFRAPCRHRLDAVVDIHVLVRRRAGKVHGRDLLGRTIVMAARLRGADRAVADDLAASRRVHPARTTMAAIAPGDALHARPCGIFSF